MITGRTQIIAHLGVPTDSFKAPMIYNPWFESQGIDTVVVPMGCEAADYPDFLRLLFRLRNIAGALITMPHKVTTVDLLDKVSAAVSICGACNAVKRGENGQLTGDMFDGEGFVRGALRKGVTIAGATALVVGSGGVGSAIAASLANAGVTRMGLHDVSIASSGILADRLRKHFPALEISTGSNNPAGWQMVINATPMGMHADDPLPFDTDQLDASTFVGDVVMKQAETALLRAARARGCTTQIGTDMLFEQIPAYLEFFGFASTTADELRRVEKIIY